MRRNGCTHKTDENTSISYKAMRLRTSLSGDLGRLGCRVERISRTWMCHHLLALEPASLPPLDILDIIGVAAGTLRITKEIGGVPATSRDRLELFETSQLKECVQRLGAVSRSGCGVRRRERFREDIHLARKCLAMVL